LTGNEPNWSALINACLKHPTDAAVLTQFFETILPYLRAALLSMFSRDVALVEDALQNACLKYLAIFKEKRNRPLTMGYFVVIARHSLIDELRRRKGHVPLDEIAENDLPTVPSGPDDRGVKTMLMQHALMQMDSRCQFILQSYYINEMDARTLASQLHVAPDSVHMVIKRCRDRLKSLLSKSESLLSLASTKRQI
jgi:RNA polymerase sigma factor (sigma-70 family)